MHDKAERVGTLISAVICGRVSLEPRLQVIAIEVSGSCLSQEGETRDFCS